MGKWKTLSATFVVLGLVALAPAVAGADTEVSLYDDGSESYFAIYDDGGPNTITVTTSGNVIHVTGTDLSPYEDCSGTSSVVDCTFSGDIYSDVELGGGVDVFDASGVTTDLSLNVRGDDDTDTLIGSPFGDYLTGGDDSDTLTGGEGDDYIGLAWDSGDTDSPSSTCGNGADVVSYDSADTAIACEQIRPRFTGTPALNQAPAIGATLSATDLAASGGPTLIYSYAWFGCEGACDSTAPTFTVPANAWNAFFEGYVTVSVPGGPSGTIFGQEAELFFDYLGDFPTYNYPSPSPAFDLGYFNLGKIKKNRLPISIRTAGLITVGPIPKGKGPEAKDNKYLKTAAVTASKAGTYSIAVKLSKAGTKRLKKRKKLTLNAFINFIPNERTDSGGMRLIKRVTLRLAKKKK